MAAPVGGRAARTGAKSAIIDCFVVVVVVVFDDDDDNYQSRRQSCV